jgi:hypothetical protein
MIHFRGRSTLILSLSSSLSEESVHDSVPRDIFCLLILPARRSFFLLNVAPAFMSAPLLL